MAAAAERISAGAILQLQFHHSRRLFLTVLFCLCSNKSDWSDQKSNGETAHPIAERCVEGFHEQCL